MVIKGLQIGRVVDVILDRDEPTRDRLRGSLRGRKASFPAAGGGDRRATLVTDRLTLRDCSTPTSSSSTARRGATLRTAGRRAVSAPERGRTFAARDALPCEHRSPLPAVGRKPLSSARTTGCSWRSSAPSALPAMSSTWPSSVRSCSGSTGTTSLPRPSRSSSRSRTTTLEPALDVPRPARPCRLPGDPLPIVAVCALVANLIVLERSSRSGSRRSPRRRSRSSSSCR